MALAIILLLAGGLAALQSHHYECITIYCGHAFNELGTNKSLHLDVHENASNSEARITPRAFIIREVAATFRPNHALST